MTAKKPLVAIVMGSDSDLPIMKSAADVLDQFGIPYETRILSAHRTPRETIDFASAAAQRGIEVIIAGAGGAAHLPGVIAALTHLPVIGVPIQSATLSGLDSLLSIVQMPSGIPVATVAINGAKNAAILAAKILGIKYPAIADKLAIFREQMEVSVKKKDHKLQNLGIDKYLNK